MNLVIVESPAKARTIKQYLGKGFNVQASFGHVRDLPEKGLGVDIEKNFKDGEIVSPKTLFEKRLISRKKGVLPEVKILGRGEISKKLVFQNILLSKSARVKIEKAKSAIRQ